MKKIKLAAIPTRPDNTFEKEATRQKANLLVEEINHMQVRLYAESKQALLIVIQGMDASGKDGVIKRVMSGINPQGCRVYPFKKPTPIEMGHDFLWRIHQVVPEKGMIHIFNRSHYEDVLIQRVHKWIDEKTVKQRFDHINNFEYLLESTDTRVLKFYLHISQAEQLRRLEERMVDPEKMWKHNDNDMVERARWAEYMLAYEDVFKHCQEAAPWHIIPSDRNFYKEYLIAKVIHKALKEMDPQFPSLPDKQ